MDGEGWGRPEHLDVEECMCMYNHPSLVVSRSETSRISGGGGGDLPPPANHPPNHTGRDVLII